MFREFPIIQKCQNIKESQNQIVLKLFQTIQNVENIQLWPNIWPTLAKIILIFEVLGVIETLSNYVRDGSEPTYICYKIPSNRQNMVKFCIWSPTDINLLYGVYKISFYYVQVSLLGKGAIFLMLPHFAQKSI